MFSHRHFNFKVIGYLMGVMLCVMGVMCLLPAIVSLINKEDMAYIFLMTTILYTIVGFTLAYMDRNYEFYLSKKDCQITVGIIWFVLPLFGALPYMFLPNEITIMQAIFESYSGYTTTGATIIDDFNNIPKGLLVYRALTQWVGGLGFTLFIIVSLRRFSGNFNNLFNAEFSSINKEKIHPHIIGTVQRIFIVYTSLTLICFVLLCFGDMDILTAFCHSLSTVSTGGFSTTNGNISAYNHYTQYIITLMMFLSGISYFLIIWFYQGKFKRVWKDEQFKEYFFLILIGAISFTCFWYFQRNTPLSDSIRQSLFYMTSIVSTTGFDLQVDNFGLFASVILLFLMFIGGCSASSSTGLKIIRASILIKYAKVAIRKIFHPKAIIPVRKNGQVMKDDDINVVFGFFFLYLCIFIIGTFLLTTTGNSFNNSIIMSAANISNIGPLVGGFVKDFSYSMLSTQTQIILIILMMIGRLEIYSFFAVFSKSVWGRN